MWSLVRIQARPPSFAKATDGAAVIFFMSFILFGLLVFGLGFWMRMRFKRKNHEAGVEGMNMILIAAVILVIFYGIVSKMMIK